MRTIVGRPLDSRRFWRWVGAAVVLGGCSTNPYLDPYCETRNAEVTFARISLYRADGSPIELPDATVTCTQGSSAEERAQYRPEFLKGNVLIDGGVGAVMGDGVAFNAYLCGLTGIVLKPCGAPLRVRVTAPGCEPVDLTWSWDDNYRAVGSNTDFIVPVRMQCAADAGVDPAMHDIPALDHDSGGAPRP